MSSSSKSNKIHLNLIPTNQKKNPFEFNAHTQYANQIKHLEQTKERNKKGEVKVLGLGAMRDEEHSDRWRDGELWVLCEEKRKRDSSSNKAEIFLSSNKIVLNVLYKSYKYSKNLHTYTKHNLLFLFFYSFWKHVIRNIVPIRFLRYEYFKYVFSQQFLNHSFHFILKTNT